MVYEYETLWQTVKENELSYVCLCGCKWKWMEDVQGMH